MFLMVVLLIASPSHKKTSTQDDESRKAAIARFPNGTILIQKDGDFKVVREYKVNGERVDYFSLERGEWEVIPASLIDWEKTKKIADEREKEKAALIAKINTQEKARRAETPLDVDASVDLGHGIFLPSGEGLFVFDGKEVKKLVPADAVTKLDKMNVAKRIIFNKIPIIPTVHVISLRGDRAEFRFVNGQLEFYLRTTETSEPSLDLIRTVVRKKTRQIEKVDELFGQQRVKKDTVTMQLWPYAPGLYRVTLGEGLTPGEYVIAQILDGEEKNVILWDFGIDAENAANPKKK